MEEGGDRWSKPHVSTISLHALMDLRSFLLNGTVLLDMEASSLESIAELILENMVSVVSTWPAPRTQSHLQGTTREFLSGGIVTPDFSFATKAEANFFDRLIRNSFL